MRLCTPRASGWIGILGQCDQAEETSSSAEGAQPGQIVILFWPWGLHGMHADCVPALITTGPPSDRRCVR